MLFGVVPPLQLPGEAGLEMPPIPAMRRTFPEPFEHGEARFQFKIRGIKGWAWAPEQYEAEIPTLRTGRMNFLMNCYLSMFTDVDKGLNEWWKPLPEAKKRAYEHVVRSCRASGITFCFAMHPQLSSSRPLKFDSEADFDSLWKHYAWMQSLGVRWFSLSLDDVAPKGEDAAALQSRFANRLLRSLRSHDPKAELLFCPTYYWGTGEDPKVAAYLRVLAAELDKNAYVFWTGPQVCSQTITAEDARRYRELVGHRLFLWDNYPVNDGNPTMHLGPVSGRDPNLPTVIDGYMSNPMRYQNEANRLPLLTCADYAFNPKAYEPGRSWGQALLRVAKTKPQRQALSDLARLYPGQLVSGKAREAYNTGYNWIRTELKEKPKAKNALLERLRYVLSEMEKAFPNDFEACKVTLKEDLAFVGRAQRD